MPRDVWTSYSSRIATLALAAPPVGQADDFGGFGPQTPTDAMKQRLSIGSPCRRDWTLHSLGETVDKLMDEPGRVLDRKSERRPADRPLPKAEDDDALVGVPGHLHPTASVSIVIEHRSARSIEVWLGHHFA
jgi:hypothetical protein